MPKYRPIRVAVVLVCTLSVLMGCSPGQSSEAPISSAPIDAGERMAGYPARWIPTPALDLESPQGTFVRAIIESDYRAMRLGPSVLPIGYEKAVNDTLSFYSYTEIHPLRQNSDHTRSAYFWAAPLPAWHILRDYSGDPIPPLTPDTRAVAICNYAIDQLVDVNASLFFVYRTTGQAPQPTQEGAAITPTGNPFGDWYIEQQIAPFNEVGDVCDTPPIPIDQLDTTIGTPDPGWPTSGV